MNAYEQQINAIICAFGWFFYLYIANESSY